MKCKLRKKSLNDVSQKRKNEAADTWELTKKYNIQKIRSSNEGKYEDIIDRVSRTYGIPKTLIQKND